MGPRLCRKSRQIDFLVLSAATDGALRGKYCVKFLAKITSDMNNNNQPNGRSR